MLELRNRVVAILHGGESSVIAISSEETGSMVPRLNAKDWQDACVGTSMALTYVARLWHAMYRKLRDNE